jgi:hypothetical protein
MTRAAAASAFHAPLTPPRVVGITIPAGERRTPVVCASVALGPVVVLYTVARLRKGGIVVRPPVGPSCEDAITMPEPMRAEIAAAILSAVHADAEASMHLAKLRG